MSITKNTLIGGIAAILLSYANVDGSRTSDMNRSLEDKNISLASPAKTFAVNDYIFGNAGTFSYDTTYALSYDTTSDKSLTLDNKISNDRMPIFNVDSVTLSRQLVEDMAKEVIDELHPPHLISKNYVVSGVFVESSNNPYSISRMDARGLLQIKKDAWEQVERVYDYDTYAFDPKINLRVGVKYMTFLLSFLRKNYSQYKTLDVKEQQNLLSAAWNAGPGRLMESNWQITELPQETINHVKKINDKLYAAKKIYINES